MTLAIITQAVVESVSTVDPAARITSLCAETVSSTVPSLRLTSISVEAVSPVEEEAMGACRQ